MSITDQNRKWWILLAAGLLYVAGNIDYTAINLALAPIAKDFHAGLSDLQWVINGFILASMVLMIFIGRLSDIFGRKKFFLIGAIGFSITSLIAGFSPNETTLIISRILQGVVCSFAFVVMSPMVFMAFPKTQRGMAVGFLMGAAGFGQALGPSFGGFLIHILSWRWIFFINVPIGIASMIIGLFACQTHKLGGRLKEVDFAGAALLITGLILIVFALNQSYQWQLNSLKFISVFSSGIVILIIFGFFETKVKKPLIDLSLMRNFPYLNFVGVRFFYTYAFGSLLFITGLYLINVLGYTIVMAGLILFSMSLLFGIVSPFTGRVIDLVGVKKPLMGGVLIGATGFIFVTAFGLFHELWLLIVGLMLIGLVTGVMQGAPTTGALAEMEEDQVGVAMGLMFTVALGAFVLSVAVTGFIQAALSMAILKTYLPVHHIYLSAKQWVLVQPFADGSRGLQHLHSSFSYLLAGQLKPILQKVFSQVFVCVMLINVFFCLGTFVLTFFISKGRRSD